MQHTRGLSAFRDCARVVLDVWDDEESDARWAQLVLSRITGIRVEVQERAPAAVILVGESRAPLPSALPS
jgi:hypothetical protein